MTRVLQCDCGVCPRCRHRATVRTARANAKKRREAGEFIGVATYRTPQEVLEDSLIALDTTIQGLVKKRRAMKRRARLERSGQAKLARQALRKRQTVQRRRAAGRRAIERRVFCMAAEV